MRGRFAVGEHTVIVIKDPEIIQKRAAPNTEKEDLSHKPSKYNVRYQKFD